MRTGRYHWRRMIRTSAVTRLVVLAVVLAAAVHQPRGAIAAGPPSTSPPGMPAHFRPYGASSPFNTPLPSHPRLAPNSSAMVERVTSLGGPANLVAGTAGTADDWSHPTYYARPSDPVFSVDCAHPSWGPCPVQGLALRIPDAARPAAGGDGHMTVVDFAAGWEWDFWQVTAKPRHGGVLRATWGGRIPVAGDGAGSEATAGGFGNLAGIIRAPELEAGVIPHALFMVAYCDAGRSVFPATRSDPAWSCAARRRPTADAPPMGARFQLAMSDAEIAALRVPPWKRAILQAMARYGMFLGDNGGGSWGVELESGATYTSFGQPDRIVAYARRAHVPRYHHWYVFDLATGIDWGRYLRVVDPCVSQRTC